MRGDGIKAQENTEFIILTGLRARRHSTPHGKTTWEDTRVARRQVAGVRGKSRSRPCQGFLGKGKAGQDLWSIIGQCG